MYMWSAGEISRKPDTLDSICNYEIIEAKDISRKPHTLDPIFVTVQTSSSPTMLTLKSWSACIGGHLSNHSCVVVASSDVSLLSTNSYSHTGVNILQYMISHCTK